MIERKVASDYYIIVNTESGERIVGVACKRGTGEKTARSKMRRALKECGFGRVMVGEVWEKTMPKSVFDGLKVRGEVHVWEGHWSLQSNGN